MKKSVIEDYAKKCMPYFNSLNKEQKIQFICSLPLNGEEYNCFLSTLLIGHKGFSTQGIQFEALNHFDIDLNISKTR